MERVASLEAVRRLGGKVCGATEEWGIVTFLYGFPFAGVEIGAQHK